MTSREQEIFHPDEVDEQIDAYLAASSTDEQPLDPHALTAIQSLQRSLAPGRQEVALQRVWSRFQQARAALRQRELAQQAVATQQNRRYPMRHVSSDQTKERKNRLTHRLNLIAAVIFVVLLVGSMALVFKLVSSKTSHSGSPIPAPASKVMFAINDQTLYRLDINTHQPLWHFKPASDVMFPLPGQFVRDTFYISTDSSSQGGWLYALDVVSGKVRWRVDSPFREANPTISNDAVYLTVAKNDNMVIRALDRMTGALKWEHAISKASDGGFDVSAPVLAATDQSVFGEISSHSGNQRFALSAQSGKLLWQKSQQIAIGPLVPMFVFNGVLNAVGIDYGQGGNDQKYYYMGYSATTGEQLWSHLLDGLYADDGVAVLNGVIYLKTLRTNQKLGSHYYAYFMKDGTLLWQYSDSDITGSTYPTVTKGGLFFYRYDANNSPNHLTPLVALDPQTGRVRWVKKFETAAPASPPVADDDKVYLSTPTNAVEIVRAADGKLLGSFKVNGKVIGAEGVRVQVFDLVKSGPKAVNIAMAQRSSVGTRFRSPRCSSIRLL